MGKLVAIMAAGEADLASRRVTCRARARHLVALSNTAMKI
jgi:hypothetical protein